MSPEYEFGGETYGDDDLTPDGDWDGDPDAGIVHRWLDDLIDFDVYDFEDHVIEYEDRGTP